MDTDPFDTLGLPPRFDTDKAAVQARFLERSRLLHPDRAGDADPAAFARLNTAKAVLDDPEQRAEALLRRLGGPSPSQDRSLPQGFLAEMLQIREQIESVSTDPDAVARWEDWAAQRRKGHVAAVAELFRTFDQSPSPDTLASIRRELNVWRYTERLLEQLAAP